MLFPNRHPEVTGTHRCRTEGSDRGGMKVGEVKGLVYENDPLIEVRTRRASPGTGHMSVTTGGVCIGSCAEEKREVMKLIEAMEIDRREDETNRVGREDAWGPDTVIRLTSIVRSLCLYTHVSSTITTTTTSSYASAPSSPIYARSRGLHTRSRRNNQ